MLSPSPDSEPVMKTSISRASILLIGLFAFAASSSNAQTSDDISIEAVQTTLESESERSTLTPEEWKSFGKRLTEALASENRGVQVSALRLAAYYGDRLQMGRQAAVSAVRFYRDDPDPHVRKLAVVAIARINHPWGIDFLTRSLEYEDSVGVEKVMRNALQERTSTQEN